MAGRQTLWLMVPEPVRRLPADLAFVIALTLVTVLVVLLPGVRETPIRVLFGLPFVLFLPGYAFIAALFPEAGEPPTGDEEWEPGTGVSDETVSEGSRRDRGIDGIERVALSFGLSIAIVPLLGLVLNFTPWGIRLAPILVSVGGFTILCAVVAAYRRWELPPEDRFSMPYREWLSAGRAELFEPDDRVDAALNVALALAILLAISSVAYAVAVPPQGEQFSAVYLLTEDGDGDLVAAEYPSEFALGESAPLVVGVDNHEHERVDYTVVVQLQRVEWDENETAVTEPEDGEAAGGNETVIEATVVERAELDRFRTTLDHDESWHHPHEVSPTLTGENLRLTYLLYVEEAPAEPTRENSYRNVHLWINVTDEGDPAESIDFEG